MSFDPYLEWLGIAEERRPPTHYELLGLKPFESHPPAIHDAILARATLVRKYQVGRREEDAQRLLEELQQAYGCLSDPARKAAYDVSLRGAPTISSDPATSDTLDDVPDDYVIGLEDPPPKPAVQQANAPAAVPRASPVPTTTPPVARRPIAVPATAGGQPISVEATSKTNLRQAATETTRRIVPIGVEATSKTKLPRAMQAALAVAAAVVVLFLIGQMFSSTDTSTSAPAEEDVASVEVVPATITPPEDEAKPAAMPQPSPPTPVVPSLAPIAPQQINEGRELMLKATTTNAPPSGKSWSFRLEPGAPAGATIDSVTGILTWTPTEEQGPDKYPIGIAVFDPTSPALRSTTSFQIDVQEVNRSPALEPIADQTIEAGKPLRFKVVATDADVPAQTIKYRLRRSLLASAEINERSGEFSWTPATTDVGQTFSITVSAYEDAPDGREDARTVRISVTPPAPTGMAGSGPSSMEPRASTGTLLVSEEFDRVTNTIREFSTPSIQTNVIGGKYVMRRVGNDGGTIGIGGPTFEQTTGDFSCEVVGRITGSGFATWGLRIDGTAPSGSNTLRTHIHTDGRFSGVGNSVRHPDIKSGSEWNTLTMHFRGQQVDVFVNGTKIVDNHQATQVLSPARVSLYVVGPTGTTAEFDRIRIWSGGAAAPDIPVLPKMTNSIGMEFVQIPAGEFLMGSPVSDSDADATERPQHKVQITKPFYLGTCEVTQSDFQTVTQSNPSWFTNVTRATGSTITLNGGIQLPVTVTPMRVPTPRLPVESVTMRHVTTFCSRLAALPEEKNARRKYRLPTEAEWEYACRATSNAPFSSAGSIPVGREPKNVGSVAPNAWGLHDMHGNIAELCQDRYNPVYYAKSPTSDPQNKLGKNQVVRGGHLGQDRKFQRSAARQFLEGDAPNRYVGFRVVCEAP